MADHILLDQGVVEPDLLSFDRLGTICALGIPEDGRIGVQRKVDAPARLHPLVAVRRDYLRLPSPICQEDHWVVARNEAGDIGDEQVRPCTDLRDKVSGRACPCLQQDLVMKAFHGLKAFNDVVHPGGGRLPLIGLSQDAEVFRAAWEPPEEFREVLRVVEELLVFGFREVLEELWVVSEKNVDSSRELSMCFRST